VSANARRSMRVLMLLTRALVMPVRPRLKPLCY
jgi:hypothetical protein